MVWPVVELGDVKDAYGFVQKCIMKSGIKPPNQDEYQELMCDGVVILCALYERYDPSKDKGRVAPRTGGGASKKGVASFAGYASFLLPRKLRDAWHRSHENHVTRTDSDGNKQYIYHETAMSLDQLRDSRVSGGTNRGGDFDERKLRRVGDFAEIPLPS